MNTSQTRQAIVVIVNPNHSEQPALVNLIRMITAADNASEFELVVVVSPGSKGTDASSVVVCTDGWLEEVVHGPLRELGISYTINILWSPNWDEAILEINEKHNAILTVLPYYTAVPGVLLHDEKWKLLRNATNPVLISSQVRTSETRTILCALKVQDRKYTNRNQRVIDAVKSLSEVFGLDIHAVNAYTDSMEFPDRALIANQIGIDNNNIHVKHGDPQEVICDTADSLDAGLVVMASQQRSGLQGSLRNNMIEKVIERIDCNVLMV